jgi:hypothetical protein
VCRILHRVQHHCNSHVRVSDHVNLTDSELAADGFQIIYVLMDAPFQL